MFRFSKYSSERHWAAVRIHRSAMSVPAQTNSYRPLRQYLICATHAQLPGTEGRPSAIFKFTGFISFSAICSSADSCSFGSSTKFKRSSPSPISVTVYPQEETGLYRSRLEDTSRRNRRLPNVRKRRNFEPSPKIGWIAGLPHCPSKKFALVIYFYSS